MFDGKDEEFRRPLSAIRETSATETKNLNKGRKSVIFEETKMTETEIPKKSKNGSSAAPFITKTNRKESTDSVFNSAKDRRLSTDRRQSIDSKRTGISTNKFKGLVRTQILSTSLSTKAATNQFRGLIRNYVMSKLTGDGRSFSGLPMNIYIPDFKNQEKFENTYNMEPEKLFCVATVKPKICEIVSMFSMSDYTPSHAADNVKSLCDRVREELKRFNFKRYRFIVSGFMTKIEGQGISIASQGILNPEYDRFFQCEKTNKRTYTLCTVHAVYLE